MGCYKERREVGEVNEVHVGVPESQVGEHLDAAAFGRYPFASPVKGAHDRLRVAVDHCQQDAGRAVGDPSALFPVL